MKHNRITYAEVGDNYDTKDPIKILAQKAAIETADNLKEVGFEEVADSRGESAYVWKQGNSFMASVVEGLGTKNLVADAMRAITGDTYYDVIAHDTVATVINDLTTVGAKPLVMHAYWAIENNDWLADTKRMTDFITGWKEACNIAGVSWGGGETPTLKGIISPGTVALGGSAIGFIASKKRLIRDNNLKSGDRIILLKSNGINANGLSLARAVAKKLKKGYETKLPDKTLYGDALLTKTNLYAKLIQRILDSDISIHYISNITGHGLRKVMRAKGDFSYILENIFEPQPLFHFLQEYANASDYDMYEEFNMGQDYAIFVAKQDVGKTLKICKKMGFEAIDAGFIEKGEKKVFIAPKNITYSSDRLIVR